MNFRDLRVRLVARSDVESREGSSHEATDRSSEEGR